MLPLASAGKSIIKNCFLFMTSSFNILTVEQLQLYQHFTLLVFYFKESLYNFLIQNTTFLVNTTFQCSSVLVQRNICLPTCNAFVPL